MSFLDALKTTGRDLSSKSWWRNEIFLVINQDKTYISAPEEKIFILPTRVLVELPSYKIVAFGHDARPVEYAGVKQAKVIKPCNSYKITDEEASVVLLRAVMQMVLGSAYFLKPRVFISDPSHTTPFMQELRQLVLYKAGARDVVPINPLLAVAVGAGLPVADGHGYGVGWWEDGSLVLGLLAFGNVQYEQRFVWSDWATINSDSEDSNTKQPAQKPRSQQKFAGEGEGASGTFSTKESLKNTDRADLANFFASGWRRFVNELPGEFRTTLGTEGLILSIDDDDPQLPLALSQAISHPVQVIPRNVEILGLQRIASQII